MNPVSRFELVRATPANGLFQRLKHEWSEQLAHEDAPTTLYIPMMDHAERISAEHPQDPRYGIFVVLRYDDGGNLEAYEGMIHINHALPTQVPQRCAWSGIWSRLAMHMKKSM